MWNKISVCSFFKPDPILRKLLVYLDNTFGRDFNLDIGNSGEKTHSSENNLVSKKVFWCHVVI